MKLNHLAVYLQLTQHCKLIIIFKIVKQKKKRDKVIMDLTEL